MRYWALLSIPMSILVGVSCDKLWSSSIVDCGRPGFTCPEGYSPDMPLSEGDGGTPGSDGGAGDQGGPGSTDMAVIAPSAYSSIYVTPDSVQTTLIGTGDGRVRTYANDGSGKIKFVSEFTELSGVPIVGLWRGKFYNGMGYTTFTIVVPNTNKFYTHINTGVGNPRSVNDTLNSLFVNGRNGYYDDILTTSLRMFITANNGKVYESDIQPGNPITITTPAATTIPTAANINTIAGLEYVPNEGMVTRSCIPGPCANTDIAWAGGDGGKLFNRDDTGWHILPILGTVLPTARFLGVASGYRPNPATPAGFAVGKDGVYVERENGDAASWQTLTNGPFGSATLNAACFFTDDEGWAVGDGGKVFRYQGQVGTGTWSQVNLSTLGKNLSAINLRAVQCTRPSSSWGYRRVTIVGSENTLFYGDDSSLMGNYTWTLVE